MHTFDDYVQRLYEAGAISEEAATRARSKRQK
jgi:Tfp pilus assembly pilus retraction ATPase PilT